MKTSGPKWTAHCPSSAADGGNPKLHGQNSAAPARIRKNGPFHNPLSKIE
jgi:hypothetical protein